MDKALELRAALSSSIFKAIETDEFKEKLIIILKSELIKIVLMKKEELLNAEVFNSIKLCLRKDLLCAASQTAFKDSIYKIIDDNLKSLEKSNETLGSIIPPAFVNSLKVYVYNHSDEISSALRNLINSEHVVKKINSEVSTMLNGFNPMITRFINATAIQGKIIAGINNYLDDSKNMMDLVNFINSMLDNLMAKKVSEFASYFPIEGRKSLIDSISSEILNNVFSEKLIDLMLIKLEDIIKYQLINLNEDSSGLNDKINCLASYFMNISYPVLLESDSIKELIEFLSNNLMEIILNKPLIDLLGN